MWRSVWQNFVLNKSTVFLFWSNFWHVFWIEQSFSTSFLFFLMLCVVGLQRAFTVKPNWVRGNCPFPSLAEDPINQGIHRLSHLCLRARGSGPPRSNSEFFTAQTYPSTPPSGRQSPRRSMGAMFPPSRPGRCSRCVGRGKRNLILAGFSLGPLLWFYPMLLAWRH